MRIIELDLIIGLKDFSSDVFVVKYPWSSFCRFPHSHTCHALVVVTLEVGEVFVFLLCT